MKWVGGEGRNRPFIPAFAVQICLISLGIQANSSLPNHAVFNSFGVRFGVRELSAGLATVGLEAAETSF
jgi:hypothetical protein